MGSLSEEMNRQITGRLADIHFAPTTQAKKNLLNEGVKAETIIVTGNTVIDALQDGIHKINVEGYTNDEIEKVKEVVDPSKKLILITGHRQ